MTSDIGIAIGEFLLFLLVAGLGYRAGKTRADYTYTQVIKKMENDYNERVRNRDILIGDLRKGINSGLIEVRDEFGNIITVVRG